MFLSHLVYKSPLSEAEELRFGNDDMVKQLDSHNVSGLR
jgi:hypothetical protein